jgi:hypothetical protein
MMMINIEREIGNLEARVQAVETDVQAMRIDVREIRDALVGVKGGWRVLMIVIGLAATMGAALGKYVPLVLGWRG